jgi:sphingolipid delta-4 desaturase
MSAVALDAVVEQQMSAERDFYWVDSLEPHAKRRRAILAKYGDKVRALYGHDSSTAVQVVAVMGVQLVFAYLVRNMPWWKVLVLAYTVSGTCNKNLLTAQHELSHFLAFRKPLYNRILSIASNCPIVAPMAVSFRKYHQEHHSHLGVDDWDVDLPTALEANAISSFLAKLVWTYFYIVVYGVRPLLIKPKKPTMADAINWVTVIGFDLLVLYFLGGKSLVYLLMGTIYAGGLHPMGGSLIAEHYMFLMGQETYSYYGPLNALTYHVGYHNEHHDFPQIPHTRLHQLHEIAPEFYKTLPFHTSWTWITWTFVTNPSIGPWTRMRRQTRDGTEGGHKENANISVFDDITNTVAKKASSVARRAPAAVKI